MKQIEKDNLKNLGINNIFELIKDPSIIEFRKNINYVIDTLGNNDILNKVYSYYDEILNTYNKDTKLFKDYEICLKEIEKYGFIKKKDREDYLINKKLYYNFDSDFINNPKVYLQKLTSKKISEIVVDYLFSDNIYNVFLNIEEIIRYHENNNISLISKNIINFYKKIYFIDSLENTEKIELLNIFKNSYIDMMYYYHLNLMKIDSYKKINNKLLKFNDYKTYDYQNKKGYLLARSLHTPWNDKTTNIRDSYFIVDLSNPKLFHNDYLYGYNNLNINKIIHVSNKDAASTNNNKDNIFVNRIMNIEELTKGKMNEIQILNDKKNHYYLSRKPDYMIALEKVSDKILKESKRLDIPIVIIKKEKVNNIHEDNNILNITYTSDLSFEEERNKRR